MARSPEQREQIVALLRDGVGTREVSRRTGVPPATISAWAKTAGVDSPRAAQVEAATTATRIAWAQRRATLADRMGDVIVDLLDDLEDSDDPKAKKDLAVTAAILVDKAQLVSGGVTSRHEQLDAQRRRERVGHLQDELSERRTQRDGTTGS